MIDLGHEGAHRQAAIPNASSRVMLVRWPSMVIERLRIFALFSDCGSGKTPTQAALPMSCPMRIYAAT